MKSLLDKSEENYASFKILKDAGKYSSCVHCAYYSAFQLSIHSDPIEIETQIFSPSSSPWSIDQFSCA